MRRSKRRRRTDSLSVSLFPFLAVLICTLGVLIVMLVISVQSASTEASARRAANSAKQQQTLNDVKEQGELLSFEAENVKLVRTEVSQRLASAKADRSYLQQQIATLESDAKEIYLQYQTLQQRQRNPQSVANVSDNELAELEKQIAQAQNAIKNKRALHPQNADSAAKVNYQIVPWTGTGGTLRRPIFIECDADGLLFQPYGIRLGKNDFVAADQIGNVLDSALLAIREYHKKHGLTDEQAKPYPLLVIRPEGAWAYTLARRAMKSWDDEFGYELVDRDKELEFGDVDPNLQQHIRETIDSTYRRQLARLSRTRQPAARFGTAYRDGEGSSFLGATSNVPNPNSRLVSASHQNDTRSETEFSSTGSRDTDSQRSQNQTRGRNQKSDLNSQTVTQSNSSGPSADGEAAFGTGGTGKIGSTLDESIARQRGANWALPSQTPGARAYIRPIRLACDDRQIIILSQNKIVTTINLPARTGDAVEQLVAEIWKTIDQWGIAGQNAFWKPELRFSVLPGGQKRFDDLQVLLDQSGLIVEAVQ